jgi:hypothetical protein
MGESGLPEDASPGDGVDWDELGDAARRGLQRAGIHLMRAAIEVVAAVGAFLDELQDGEDGEDGDDPPDGGRRIIDIE